MNGEVSFTLSKMEEVFSEGSECEVAFANAIAALDANIANLANYWVSSETGTYEAFKALYDQKKPKLQEADQLMKEFLAKIEERKNRYSEAATRTINMFE